MVTLLFQCFDILYNEDKFVKKCVIIVFMDR